MSKKDTFVKSLSGTRVVRLSRIQEFLLVPTGSLEFPNSHSLIAVVGKGDHMRMFTGTKEECEAHLFGVLEGGK